MSDHSLLIVDDDPAVRELLHLLLRGKGFCVRACENGVQAVLEIESAIPDLLISDLRMPQMDGLELLRHVKGRWPELPVILLTVVEDIDTVVEAVQLGATNYILKPASPEAILAAVRKSLGSVTPRPPAPAKIAEILGSARNMVEVRRLVAIAASSAVNVLITGETGTGKELVARAVHKYSSLSSGPFVAHNCATTPHELFGSEFFGHGRGAFTGAQADHVGLLEQASGGVLLLDELEALSPQDQAKLLRVLEDGEVRPLGSNKVQQVSVRFLAASNRNPHQLIAERALREDLYYRLCGLEIWLPPLRERRADIPLLARHFLGAGRSDISVAAMETLCAYHWPGNVRQLRNVVRSAMALAGAGQVDLCHLALDRPANGRAESHPPRDPPPDCSPRAGTLKELENQAIREALQAHAGNLSRAARALGIDRSTLRRKIRELESGGAGRN